jgi:pimeloyl-ACP methyl ester carboxylesterase
VDGIPAVIHGDTRGQPCIREVLLQAGDTTIPATLLSPAVSPAPGTALVIFSNGLGAPRHEAIPPGVRANPISPPLVSALLSAGYSVLVPDNPLHGERTPPGAAVTDVLRQELARDAAAFLSLVFTETTSIIEGAVSQGLVADPRRVAAVGHSWGGLQSLLRFAGDQRIAAAVAIIPVVDPVSLDQFRGLREQQPGLLKWLAGRLAGAAAARPLRLIAGEEDATAPADLARRLAAAVAPAYAASPERLDYRALRGVGHEFAPQQATLTIEWLSRYLPAAVHPG